MLVAMQGICRETSQSLPEDYKILFTSLSSLFTRRQISWQHIAPSEPVLKFRPLSPPNRSSEKMRNLHPPNMQKRLRLPLFVVVCLVADTSNRVIGTPAITLTEPTLTNISTRAFVQTGDNVVIGGFTIDPPPTPSGQSRVEGEHLKRVIIRPIGPELTQYGIPNALVIRHWSCTTVLER